MSIGDNRISRPSDSDAMTQRPPTGKSVVSVVATRPQTVLPDIDQAMLMAGVEQYMSPELATLLKINISWQHWYPACSTSPWQ